MAFVDAFYFEEARQTPINSIGCCEEQLVQQQVHKKINSSGCCEEEGQLQLQKPISSCEEQLVQEQERCDTSASFETLSCSAEHCWVDPWQVESPSRLSSTAWSSRRSHGKVNSSCSSIELGGVGFTKEPPACWDDNRYMSRRILRPARDAHHAQIELWHDYTLDMPVVVKRFSKRHHCFSQEEFQSQYPYDLEDPWQEFHVAQRLEQLEPQGMPGVLTFYGGFLEQKRGDLLLVSEWFPGGDLFTYVSNLGPAGPEREAQIMPVLQSLLKAVRGLHCVGVARCDISVENALIRQDGDSVEVVLLDFAMAVMDEDLEAVSGMRGKPMYQAPEMVYYSPLLGGAVYDARASDLFACGVVAYTLAIGNYPWSSTSPGMDKAFKYAQDHGMHRFFQKRYMHGGPGGQGRTRIADILSPSYQRILAALLDMDPQGRCDPFLGH